MAARIFPGRSDGNRVIGLKLHTEALSKNVTRITAGLPNRPHSNCRVASSQSDDACFALVFDRVAKQLAAESEILA